MYYTVQTVISHVPYTNNNRVYNHIRWNIVSTKYYVDNAHCYNVFVFQLLSDTTFLFSATNLIIYVFIQYMIPCDTKVLAKQ